MDDRVVLFDFDGTLAWREGLWGGCVMEVLAERGLDTGVTVERVRAGLENGFPWHRAGEPHLHLNEPEAWWMTVQSLIANAVMGAGLSWAEATAVADWVRARFSDPSQVWRVFGDTVPALQRLQQAGWRAAVLSNHIPELADLVDGLGLAELVDPVLSSALIGYEKPHPEAFAIAIQQLDSPSRVWMVGDNPIADIQGAEAAGIPAVLVRTSGPCRHRRDDVRQAVDFILDETMT